MKNFLVLLFLIAIGTSVYAQKSYVNVFVSKDFSNTKYHTIIVTGDIPSNIKTYYNYEDNVLIGELLNLLSQKGYEVEFMSGDGNGRMNYLLSKKTSSNQTQIEGDVNNDGEVTISDVNKVINIILGIVRENPSLLEQYGK